MITERAMLAAVHISIWTAVKHDRKISYWLSMAIHRKNPRRVLTALRYLLTDPLR